MAGRPGLCHCRLLRDLYVNWKAKARMAPRIQGSGTQPCPSQNVAEFHPNRQTLLAYTMGC